METPRRRALGKGLEELFNNEVINYSAVEEQIVNETPKDDIVMINLDAFTLLSPAIIS